MEEKNSLCWCGSGKAYADCHQMIDAKIELLRSQGKEVPDRCMIKTPEQIAEFCGYDLEYVKAIQEEMVQMEVQLELELPV